MPNETVSGFGQEGGRVRARRWPITNSLVLAVSEQDSSVKIEVAGEIDLATAPQLARCFDAAWDAGARHVTVDFARVAFIDSQGLYVIVRASKRGLVTIVAAPKQIERLFSLTGINELVEFQDS
jgi:anti-sigma B factor antagonist